MWINCSMAQLGGLHPPHTVPENQRRSFEPSTPKTLQPWLDLSGNVVKVVVYGLVNDVSKYPTSTIMNRDVLKKPQSKALGLDPKSSRPQTNSSQV